jgi:hypothetical protein
MGRVFSSRWTTAEPSFIRVVCCNIHQPQMPSGAQACPTTVGEMSAPNNRHQVSSGA